MSRIIALSAYKYSGKDTMADYLVQNYGYEKLSFATVLKDQVARQYNLHRSLMDHPKLKEEPLLQYPVITADVFTATIHDLLKEELKSGYWTPRALLIMEGSIKRSVTARFWIEKAIEKIKQNPGKRYVISDMRFKAEADILNMLLPRDQLLLMRISRHSEAPATLDPSERDLDDYHFDVHMSNTGTIPEFHQAIDSYMKYKLGMV